MRYQYNQQALSGFFYAGHQENVPAEEAHSKLLERANCDIWTVNKVKQFYEKCSRQEYCLIDEFLHDGYHSFKGFVFFHSLNGKSSSDAYQKLKSCVKTGHFGQQSVDGLYKSIQDKVFDMTEKIVEAREQLPEHPARVHGVDSLGFNPRMSAFDHTDDDFNNRNPANGYNLFVDVYIKKTGISQRDSKKRKAVWGGLTEGIQQSYTKKAEQLRMDHNLRQLRKIGEKEILKNTSVVTPQLNTTWNRMTEKEKDDYVIEAKKILDEKDLKNATKIATPLKSSDWTQIEPTFKVDEDFPWTALLGEKGLAALEP